MLTRATSFDPIRRPSQLSLPFGIVLNPGRLIECLSPVQRLFRRCAKQQEARLSPAARIVH